MNFANSQNNSSNTSPFNSFSTNATTYGDKGFGESNSLIAKFAFLFLVIFAFIVLLRVGIVLVSYIFKPNESPKLINGMVDAKQLIVFPQQPSSSKSTTIYRSVNATDGIEFTWSVWIYIDNFDYKEGLYKHIFYKGNSDGLEKNGLNFPNNAPGLYIAPNTNALVVMMNTFDVINDEIVIPDIPLNKWINVILRCQNNALDVYINGTISRSVQLVGVPKQNYGEVYVGMNGGFDGYISNLWYYNYALGTAEIQKISMDGPNTKMTGSNGINAKNSDYLSMRWFFYGAGDGYNP
jgi:hypothetical protein